jgi:cobalt-zinc-cadmium efflux system outer membrane protein
MVIRHWVAVCVFAGFFPSTTRAAAPERELSLEEVLQLADQSAPAIIVAGRRVGVAEADVVGAAPWLPSDPSLEAGGGGRVGGGQDGADVSVGVNQTFEIFGEAGLRRDVAARGVDAVRIDVVQARFTVHQAVHKAFHAALVADGEVKGAEDAVAFATRLVEVAEARVKAGEASSLTVRLAQTSLARAREQGLIAREVQASARLALGREAGLPDATPVKPRGALATPAMLPATEVLLDLALRHQPSLAALRAQVDVAKSRAALAEREALPKPTAGLGYSVEGIAPSSTQTQQIVGATVSLPLPFFRGNDAERARASAQQRVAEAELAGEQLLLAGHIAEARTRAEAAKARVLLFTGEILPGTDDTLAQLQTAFGLGELDLTEVMVGREQVLAARRDALLAWRAWFDALADLEAEVGAELPNTATPPDSTPRGSP